MFLFSQIHQVLKSAARRRSPFRAGVRRHSGKGFRYRPLAEVLEPRLLLTTVNWIGGSGDWSDTANWSDGATNRLPGLGDDVVIDVAGVTVTHSTGTDTVQSLNVNDAFKLSGGVLDVTGILDEQSGNTFELAGGTLANASLSANSLVTTTNTSTLDGVTLSAGSTVQVDVGGGGTLMVQNGLTIDGSLIIGDPVNGNSYGIVHLLGSQTIDGSGAIVFGNRGPDTLTTDDNQTTTFGPNLTIRGHSGNIETGGAGTRYVLQGTLQADVAGGHFDVNLGNAGENSGLMQALNGDVLTVLGTNWTNTGTIDETDSALNLGGTFTTTGLGTVTRSAGDVNVTGILDNSGSTFALNAVTGSWNLARGTIHGGEIATTGSAPLKRHQHVHPRCNRDYRRQHGAGRCRGRGHARCAERPHHKWQPDHRRSGQRQQLWHRPTARQPND